MGYTSLCPRAFEFHVQFIQCMQINYALRGNDLIIRWHAPASRTRAEQQQQQQALLPPHVFAIRIPCVRVFSRRVYFENRYMPLSWLCRRRVPAEHIVDFCIMRLRSVSSRGAFGDDVEFGVYVCILVYARVVSGCFRFRLRGTRINCRLNGFTSFTRANVSDFLQTFRCN